MLCFFLQYCSKINKNMSIIQITALVNRFLTCIIIYIFNYFYRLLVYYCMYKHMAEYALDIHCG